MLCTNLVQFWNRDPKGTFGALKSPKWYPEYRVELGPYITRKGVIGFLEFLVQRNFVELVSEGKKHPDVKQGLPTQIRARNGFTGFLVQGDVRPFDFEMNIISLVLKSNDKTVISFEETNLTKAMESGVNLINRVLLN